MGKLYLIGTYHPDKDKGPEKLKELLDNLEPDMILSETEENTYLKQLNLLNQFMHSLSPLTADYKGLQNFIKEYHLSLAFEVPTVIDYSKQRDIPHYMIDYPKTQKKSYQSLKRSIAWWINKAKNQDDFEIDTWTESFNSDPVFSDFIPELMWNDIKYMEQKATSEMIIMLARLTNGFRKDAYLESRIRELYSPDKIIAFPVGMMHTADSKRRQTLYSRLRDLSPERIPLI